MRLLHWSKEWKIEILKRLQYSFLQPTTPALLSVAYTSVCTFKDRAFSVAASTLWNSLPSELCNGSSLDSFEKAWKHFNKAYGLQPCVIIIIIISCVLLFFFKAFLGILKSKSYYRY